MNTIQWFEAEVPNGLTVKQVYGFIFDDHGRILLFEDQGVFNLPGGKPEKDESLFETLTREVLEEVQTIIGNWEYLGYQKVHGSETFAQVRIVAVVDHFLSADKDPSTEREYLRLLVPPGEVNELLGWGESGEKQIVSAIAAASKLGHKWDGTPRSIVEVN